jgi:hypothetical protein
VEYYIEARDTAGNKGYADGRTDTNPFLINVSSKDIDSPTISHTPPSTASESQGLTLSVTIVDNIKVETAWIFYRNDTAAVFQRDDLTLVSGSEYQVTIPADSVQKPSIEYYFQAFDPSGNYTISSTFTVVVVTPDTEPPLITHTPVEEGFSGVAVEIVVQVTDNVGVDSVYLHYRIFGSSSFSSVKLTLSSGVTYTGEIPKEFVTTSGVEYYLAASDSEGNTSYFKSDTSPQFVRVETIPQDLSEARSYPNPWFLNQGQPLVIHKLPPDPGMEIGIYDLMGRLVTTLRVGNGLTYKSTGNVAVWNALNRFGVKIASGTYLFVIRSKYGTVVRKMTVIK